MLTLHRVTTTALLLSALLLPVGATSTAAQQALRPQSKAACSTPLTLIERPGYSFQGQTWPASPGVPPNPISVQLPLFPGAVPSNEYMHDPDFSISSSDGLKSAVAEFATSASIPAVEAWYTANLEQCAYLAEGTGSTQDAQGHISYFFAFTAPYAEQSVSMDFELGDSGRTLILYVAYTESAVPRPADSYLPNSFVRVEIGYWKAATSHHFRPFTSRRPGEIHRLVQAINSLTTLGSWLPCPVTREYEAALFEANGQYINIVDSQCLGIEIGRSARLSDANDLVWNTFRAIARKHGRTW